MIGINQDEELANVQIITITVFYLRIKTNDFMKQTLNIRVVNLEYKMLQLENGYLCQ